MQGRCECLGRWQLAVRLVFVTALLPADGQSLRVLESVCGDGQGSHA